MTAVENDWKAWRAGGWGASDSAADYTGNYGGLYSSVADKIGHDYDTIDPALADRGHRWEGSIADAVHALTGWYVHGEQMWIEAASNKRHRCTLDGLVDPRPEIAGLDDAAANLEVKTLNSHAPAKWDYWQAQCQWQMHCTSKARALLAVATIDDADDTCTGVQLRWIDRDDYVIGQLIERADYALSLVDARQLPDPDDATDLEVVREVNALALRGAPVPDIDDLDDDLGRWLIVKAAIKDLDTERKTLEGKFRHRMEDCLEANAPKHRLRVGEPVHKFTRESEADALELFPQYAKTVLDRSAFKEAEPELYDDLKRPTTDRRITVKEITP